MVSLVPAILALLFLTSCQQLGHLAHVSYNHLAMLNSTTTVEDALANTDLTEEQKNKIKLSQEARDFAFNKLNFKRSRSYSRFAKLDRPYIVYNVTASNKWKFEPYHWNFPIVGEAPYIGFYSKEKAQEEADKLMSLDYDTSIRGVSAYSTLGYLADPLLSSMLRYSDYDLVNTIIHELTHTVIFFKNNINFNEKFAVFVANKGAEQFYLDKEGSQSSTLKKVLDSNQDDEKFSKFITVELADLKKWYEDFDHSKNLPKEEKENLRKQRLALIKTHFEKKLKPMLKTDSYEAFFEKDFNNADLIDFNTYMSNLDVFEKVYALNGSNISKFVEVCKKLEDEEDPEKALTDMIKN